MQNMTALLFWLIAAASFVQDLLTRWFSPLWLVPCGFFLIIAPVNISSSLILCTFVFLLRILHPDWIGSADPVALVFLSLLAGDRLYPLLLLSCLAGLLFSFLTQSRTVPFISCLALGAMLLAVLG